MKPLLYRRAWRMIKCLSLALLLPASCLRAQERGRPSDAAVKRAYVELTAAYAFLRTNDLDSAIAHLRAALALTPNRSDVRKELAYAYFRTGENGLAARQFEAVLSMDSLDANAAMELAYLDYESLDPVARAQSHALFNRVRSARDPVVRARAAEAFGNVDGELAARILSLQNSLKVQPGDGQLLQHLATAAQERNDTTLANATFEKLAVFYGDHVRLQYAQYLVATRQHAAAARILEKLRDATDPFVVEEARDLGAALAPGKGKP